ncbi:RidA family protein [Providencia burhodogranariea]|uniref:Endoribonuclease n=1 Tax=Providencia burhodogranariea DSM 19968 TaxID=1141662 RepID=K8WWX1_9GAMM|nr:RidA family protein [Providencia burhodogranariea]EKT60715.1 endoribonuclease [Providencia burhodogranariea DSM 19968]MCW2257443.1 enamine deaminase RidA (YjgF/YER057c/UK114 family) [Providencia alcalifaciens]
MSYKTLLLSLPLVLGVASANADGVKNHKLQGMPISESVEISATNDIIFLSGKVPTKISKDAPEGVLESYGNTEAQTINVMNQIKDHLAEIGLTLNDVVKMQVFLVGGEETQGTMDFAGFMAGYTKFYNDKSENLPARSAFQVAKLANPAWRVEIEVTAVRPKK